MRVMGISGMPGSGKALVSEIATERGAIIVSMGDIVREEAKKRGEGSKETAKNLRAEFGQYIVSELTIEGINFENEKFKLFKEKIIVNVTIHILEIIFFL